MRRTAATFFSALLYAGILLGANPVAAELSAEDRAALDALRVGDMTKVVIHDAPRDRIEEVFRDQHGNAVDLSDVAGKVVVLNLWATWCPPCLHELPSIDRLAGAMSGDDFAVIALSTDRFDVERVVKVFYEGTRLHDGYVVEHLDVLQDRTGKFALRAGALGLPVTLILDREGREIARVTGEAVWDSPEAKALLQQVIEMTAPGA